MLTGKYGLTPGDGVAPAAVDDGDRTRAKKFAEAPRGRMDTRGWGLTLGRYRTAAMRSAAAQYTKLAKEYGLKGGPARRPTQGLLDAIDATPSRIRAQVSRSSRSVKVSCKLALIFL